MASLAVEIIDRFAPAAHANYREAFEQGDELLTQYGLTTPLRVAHFMAQVFVETGALRILVENGRYGAKGLANQWDQGNWHHYFANRDQCLAMASTCAADKGDALFSLVYGNRMGNGPPATHDGWNYRGRGLLQTTGREAYHRFSERWNVDFEGDPDLIVAPAHALKPALSEWGDGHLNAAADANDIMVITHRINGGFNGLAERKAWLARIRPFAEGGTPVEHSLEWRVQEKLHQAGYGNVHPDGVIGHKSRAAILDYRARHGLAPGNAIGPDLVAALGLD